MFSKSGKKQSWIKDGIVKYNFQLIPFQPYQI
jgi:hypothetical protein